MMATDMQKIISDFSHDIKNPLHSALINIEVLLTRLGRMNSKEVYELLKHAKIIENDLQKLEKVTEKYLASIK